MPRQQDAASCLEGYGLIATFPNSGADGSTGSGIGDAVSVGGGRVGGAGGIGAKGPDAAHYGTGIDAHAGSDGLVEVCW